MVYDYKKIHVNQQISIFVYKLTEFTILLRKAITLMSQLKINNCYKESCYQGAKI